MMVSVLCVIFTEILKTKPKKCLDIFSQFTKIIIKKVLYSRYHGWATVSDRSPDRGQRYIQGRN